MRDCEAKLAMGADPNSANKMGQTALHVAAIWESMGVGAKLIEAGAILTLETISVGPLFAHGSPALAA